MTKQLEFDGARELELFLNKHIQVAASTSISPTTRSFLNAFMEATKLAVNTIYDEMRCIDRWNKNLLFYEDAKKYLDPQKVGNARRRLQEAREKMEKARDKAFWRNAGIEAVQMLLDGKTADEILKHFKDEEARLKKYSEELHHRMPA